MKRPRINNIVLAATVASLSFIVTVRVQAQACSNPCANPCNMVKNGDFSSGYTGFTCGPGMQYQAGAGSPGYECVGSSFKTMNTDWPAGLDHTQQTSSGKFLCIDGSSTSNNVIVWQTTVTPCPVA